MTLLDKINNKDIDKKCQEWTDSRIDDVIKGAGYILKKVYSKLNSLKNFISKNKGKEQENPNNLGDLKDLRYKIGRKKYEGL